MRIAIGTGSALKLYGVQEAFRKFFPEEKINVFPCSTDSKVPEQPTNERDIMKGCDNRLESVKWALRYGIDYYLGIEGGMVIDDVPYNLQIVKIMRASDGLTAFGRSSAFEVPLELVDTIKETSIKAVLDEQFDGKGGISMLSNNVTNRSKLVEEAVIMALAGIKWKSVLQAKNG